MIKIRQFAPLILIVVSLTCSVALAQEQKAEREAVVKSFKQFIADFIVSYKTNNRENVTQLGGGWVKQYYEPSIDDYTIDVRSTDSLISPYIGVCEFVLVRYRTEFHKTKDDEFSKVARMPHKHSYAFQDGKWVPKTREHYEQVLNEWIDCSEVTPSGEYDMYGCWEKNGKQQSGDVHKK